MTRIDQKLFPKAINVRQMEQAVVLGKMLKKTVFFFGGAGLGKSQKMLQIANKLFPHRVGNNLCDVRLSDKEPTDIAGIPLPIEGSDGKVRTVYAVPEFWPTDPDWEGIVFLDELPNAGLSTQHSSYQVVLDHVAGSHKFPKGCVFVAAGNRDTDNAGTTEMPGPLVNRMMVYEVDYDLDIWVEDYAVPFRVHPNIIGLLKQNPDLFYTGDVTDRQGPVFASPRQWSDVSAVLYAYEKGIIRDSTGAVDDYFTECSIQGLVGAGVDSMVMSYHIRAQKLPPIEDVFSGAVTVHKLERSDIDLLYVLTQTGLNKISDEIMMESKYSDEELVKRIGNFLNFVYTNHGADHKDTIMALIINLFTATSGKTAILSTNPRRDRLALKVRKEAVTVMAVINEYLNRYSDLLGQID